MISEATACEVAELRTEIGALTQALLLQQQLLQLMDEKLDVVLSAATGSSEGNEGDRSDPLHGLLMRIVRGLDDLIRGQAEIRRLLEVREIH